jgi:hypothetical protein
MSWLPLEIRNPVVKRLKYDPAGGLVSRPARRHRKKYMSSNEP